MVNPGLRQGDILSADLFNAAWETFTREIEGNKGGTIFDRPLQYFAHADDVNLVARNCRKLEEAFQ